MKKIVVVLSIIAMAVAADTKIGGTTYFDYTSGDETSAFNFKRQYISFSGQASEDVKYKVILDFGGTNKLDGEDKRLVSFLKKAQIDYNASFAKVSMGLIGMNTYGVQEKNWGYRFIEKSAIDKNGYSSTADIGIGFSKSMSEDLNVSLQIVNGEGYKVPQQDKHHKISLNATYGNGNLNKNDGYNAGLVYSTEASDTDPTNMMSLFGGYAASGLRVGAEYNTKTIGSEKSSLISLCANYAFKEDMDIFFRYDMDGGDPDDSTDGDNYLIAGAVLNCGSGLSVAPNIRMTSYNNNAESISEYKINVQYKF